ncbi:hypothetical protein M409DRAFT_19840 [Zasmidium cellare ATCC 36951]|uniref:Carboxypeptidase n=1 Tax=Zasmidium cellare ATCC 36951 TaxID=1080233 RepID=A0A6A6CVL0_ZASCE|nr:uncharacterized protein M409DRAFT_19840 [Zasmidium cellare ATCC 36951]KAF2170238.1 hypothetical protein M409DRAFT_19840 [Zasmidium cellare ATCC 36951]
MQLFTILALACTALAKRDSRHVRKANPPPELKARSPTPAANWQPPHYSHPPKPIIPSNPKTRKFAVDGTKIPDVDFDVGESYAGLLPISNATNASELYFWFFPTQNPEATDEILIWLNGGPGCSSLEGLLQENGPFLWQYGTYKPVKNPYTWANLTNVVWVEQPAGTGFSQKKGVPAATNEIEVAEQFLGFFKNFVDTFDLHNRKVYITGESYAGYYVPYIADAMHNKTDKRYYNVEGIMIYDPSTTYGVVADDIPAVPFVDQWSELFNLNKTVLDHLHARHEACGYAAFMEKALTYPPTGPLPTPPNVDQRDRSCSLWNQIYSAALLVNPCWDEYQVATTCPLLWDVLGFPGSFGYSPPGASIYFNRTDVQRAINAPLMEWAECSDGVLDTDTSDPSGLSVLPRVIEKNNRTIIGHGTLDFILILDGTLMMIQNMTFNGKQGFSTPPSEWSDFYVPYHEELNQGTFAGAGVFGNWHTERGLTFVRTELSGHMIPQYAPSASYRQLEFLLGRISNLGEVSNFSTQKGNYGNGNATMKMF